MADNDNEVLPIALMDGVIKVGDVSLRVYKLSNGQTVVHEDDMYKFFEAFGDVLEEDPKK